MKSIILIRRTEHQEALRTLLAEVDVESVAATGSLSQFATSKVADGDFLIMETDGSGSELSIIEQIAAQHSHLPVILAAVDPSSDFLIKAMRLGVREVLALPFKPDAVKEVVDRLRQRSASASRPQGKVIVFQPSKGGSGATFLASNLAFALAQGNRRVALLDLNLQFGDAALHVTDVSGNTTVADVAQNIQRLDEEFLMSSMIRVTPDFGVLPSPESPDGALSVRPESVQRMLDVARGRFDYVVVDIDRNLDPVSIRALDCADTIMVVLQLTLPFIRDAKRLLAVFDSLGYSRDKVRLIVNRYQKGGDIDIADVESTLGVQVGYTMPNSFNAVVASINQGTPIVRLDPNDKVSKSLMDMAHHMEQRSSAPTGGWLSRLLRKVA